MSHSKEAGRVAPRTGFRNVFVGTIDSSEHSLPVLDQQALRIATRFRLTASTARTIAEHAFQTEARR